MVMGAVTVADRLFRHQVLEWAADLADERGYTLRLYGQGWDRHPRLGRYAAGLARQGDEMLAIYLASRINLQIIETGFLHSRALDGLAAGGFFLTRRTDYDGLDPQIVRAQHDLSLHIRQEKITSLAQLEHSPDPQVQRWWQLISPGLHQPAPGEVFRPDAVLRGFELFADLPAACQIFPQFDQIAFSDRPSFAARAQQFLSDEPLRRATAEATRQVVLERFSYDARWRQFLAAILAGLSD
jgi:hypothetical protein